MIKRCNDFGAGGVSVAIGELTDGLVIDLNAVPKKYDGLDGTEIAISESQERMAVVIAPEDVDAVHGRGWQRKISKLLLLPTLLLKTPPQDELERQYHC